MKRIFVSHASADGPLVQAFVDFLIDGIGVPTDEIFCSSLAGFGIPAGQNFVEYMRSQIDNSVIVIMLMSPSYMPSAFCQAEMGAAWVKAMEIFPVVVPPTSFADVKGVMLGKQAITIDDEIRYNELREQLVHLLGFSPVNATRWDQKRKHLLQALPALMAEMAEPATVQIESHQELSKKYDEALQELERQESRIGVMNLEIADLRQLKSPNEVAQIASKFADKSIPEAFSSLAEAARSAISTLGGYGVRLLYLTDRYSKPFDARNYDTEEFDAAIRRNILSDDCKPRHDASRVSKADAAMKEIERFIEENEVQLSEYADDNFSSPLELDNEDFWNEHLM